MRDFGLYCTTCISCGKEVESAVKEVRCPGCGKTISMEWPSTGMTVAEYEHMDKVGPPVKYKGDYLVKTPATEPRCVCGRYTVVQALHLGHRCKGQPFEPGMTGIGRKSKC